MKKNIIISLFLFIVGVLNISVSMQAGDAKKSSQLEKSFTYIYDKHVWGDEESLSGQGSTLHNTQIIRDLLPKVIEKLSIKSMLDAACGDFNWMRYVDLHCNYIGVDIVEPLIKQLQKEFTDATHSFLYGDITQMELPRVDLILCKDCLQHLSYKDIFNALKNFKKTGARYLLTTTHPNHHVNHNIQSGGWQPINIQEAPFNFPKPLFMVKTPEKDHEDKNIGLWRLEDIVVP